MTVPDPLGITGRNFAGYSVEAYRGAGAFGFVYNAVDVASDTPLALKILNPGASLMPVQEFVNEGNLLLKMTGASGVLDLLDTGEESIPVPLPTGGTIALPFRYHALERAEDSLAALLPELDSLDWTSRLRLFRDVVLGLHQMHDRDIVHRDLKAENCLLFRDGRGLQAKVADLGRSRDLNMPPAALSYATERGDPTFAPPELLWGSGADTRQTHVCADLYGLGSLLFELGVGQGLTGVALLGRLGTVNHHRLLPTDVERRRSYEARVAEIRGWYQPSFAAFDAALPPAIRGHAGALLRQLCDPDPRRRLPRLRPGVRGAPGNGLCWLLNRVDIIRLTYANHLKQQQRLQSRKGF